MANSRRILYKSSNNLIKKKAKCFTVIALQLLTFNLILENYLSLQYDRAANIHRKRHGRLEEIRSYTDEWFHKCFRLYRPDFYEILRKITPILEAKHPEMAIRSSGESMNIELLLAATLRYLAGAQYIDLVNFYLIPSTSIHLYLWKTITAIDIMINNINLPSNEEEWQYLAQGWSEKMIANKQHDYLPGMLRRKWLILNSSLTCTREHIQLIFKVCCKLHNVAVTRWMNENTSYETSDCLFNDEELMENYNNNPSGTVNDPYPRQPHALQRDGQGPKRAYLTNHITTIDMNL